jgi:hypothetical protein
MASKRTRTPRWKTLNVILLVAGGAMVLERRVSLTPADHKIVLIVLVLALYTLIGLWVRSNAMELQEMDYADHREQTRDPRARRQPDATTVTASRISEGMSYFRAEAAEKRDRT